MDINNASLGIELGSTRIKAVLIDSNAKVLATGSYEWENKLVNDYWTYSLDDIHQGLRGCYANLCHNVLSTYNVGITKVKNIGISGMMHGYMAFDKDMQLLVPFRTWRNTTTGQASQVLSQLLDYNMPQRWSVAHLYQAILNDEPHVKDVAYITTLAGYIHYLLTGNKVLGIGEASGMFAIDSDSHNYDKARLQKVDGLLAEHGMTYTLADILPRVLVAGQYAGSLTVSGAKLLDASETLSSGIALCPPEGDAGTGMVATNSVKQRYGNVSVGTSIFAMIVLDKALSRPYEQIDIVTTPSGESVAMVHCNNCSSDINAWVSLFYDSVKHFVPTVTKGELFQYLFESALISDTQDLIAYSFLSGEHNLQLDEGRPLFVRTPNADFNVGSFFKTLLYSAFATLSIGMEVLTKENVVIDKMYAHGGLFKTPKVAQTVMSQAISAPVTVMDTADEGGAFGIALLAQYLDHTDTTLGDYLDKVYKTANQTTITADQSQIDDFKDYLSKFSAGLKLERLAIDIL